MVLLSTFKIIKANIPYSVQTYGSLFFYNQGGYGVTFLCSYGFWFNITKWTKMQHLCLWLLFNIVKGTGLLF